MSEVIDPDTGEITGHAVAIQAPQALAVQQDNSQSTAFMRMIEAAITRPDVDVAKLVVLFDMKRQFDADEARKAYVAAMARFKQDPPAIIKRKLVEFSGTKYHHATHADVAMPIIEGLAKVGISHRWKTEQIDGEVVVTCVLTHEMGHSEETALRSPPDISGKKNSIQSIVSAKTYLERHTLLAATGLTTADMPDDDGAAAGEAVTAAKNGMAASLIDDYRVDLEKADTQEKVMGIWSAGLKALRLTGNAEAQAELRALVATRGNALKKAAEVPA